MVSSKARQRNAERRRVYENVLRHSKTLTSSLKEEEIDRGKILSRRILLSRKFDKLLWDSNKFLYEVLSLEEQPDLRRSDKDFIAVKYGELAELLERAAYFAVALSEPLGASLYFQQAYEFHLDSLRYPNKFINPTQEMDSLRERSVACAYEAARRKNSCWNFFRN